MSTDAPPIRVHVASVSDEARPAPSGRSQERYRAVYTTVQLTASDPVQDILPEDPDRVEAYVIALDNDIVIGTRNQVSAEQNTAAGVPYPIGAFIPAKTTGGSLIPFPVKDCNAVYAGVTTTASNSRVSVAAYYRSPA
jgi:hypothetical protein